MSAGSTPIYQIAKLICGVDYNNQKQPYDYIPYIFEIYSDSHLLLNNPQHDVSLTISLKKVMIQVMSRPSEKSMKSPVFQNPNEKLIEFVIYCQAINGQRLALHCLTSEKQQYEIFYAIKEVSSDHNIDSLLDLPPPSPNSSPPPPPPLFSPSPSPYENNTSLTGNQARQDVESYGAEQPAAPSAAAAVNEPVIVIYQSDRILFSAIRERNLRFAVVWKPWETRTIRITSDGVLTYQKPNRPGDIPRHKMFNVHKVEVTLLADNERDDVEFGVTVKCHTLDGIESYFRAIFDEQELDRFVTCVSCLFLISYLSIARCSCFDSSVWMRERLLLFLGFFFFCFLLLRRFVSTLLP
jgi:hypothetical protein